MQRSSSITNSGTVAHPACASCKHQRKKCGEDCILAPYFPADRSREFQAVHKVFGVSNVMKLVRSVKEEDRKTVADSLVWEAFCRQNDPILGPLGEYRKIQEELKLFKNQSQTQTKILNQNQLVQQPECMMYKATTPGMVAWNNGTNGVNNKGVEGGLANNNNNNMVNFSHDNGNTIYSSYPLNYVQGPEKVMKQEKDVNPRLLPLQQPQQQHHHSVTAGFNHQQQYYLPGQFGYMNGKTMDNTAWEAGP
ncbi:hypothetical protein P3X46_012377 [Hevea brasiliensis]|uniref:LOB domain-containing protein n=1 Tax=Hevea brasiliensis TaxID=3981 RepID=A0ABQ9MA06_HEVBR|nr:LOB domain-containing protein 2-like [Hevea brasiliensis]KAJ9177127.1 hypothetical protein P3X46_012377 [Hevea brasiliensis]